MYLLLVLHGDIVAQRKNLLLVLGAQEMQFLQELVIVAATHIVVLGHVEALLLFDLLYALQIEREKHVQVNEGESEHCTDCLVHLLVEFEFFAQRLVLVLQIDAK